MVENFEWAE